MRYLSDYQILDMTKIWPRVEIFEWLPNTRYDQELRYLSDYQILDIYLRPRYDQELRYLSDVELRYLSDQILDMTKSWDIWVTTKY